jgi:hypothetical protein
MAVKLRSWLYLDDMLAQSSSNVENVFTRTFSSGLLLMGRNLFWSKQITIEMTDYCTDLLIQNN